MEDSAYNALYTGAYIFVFIVSLTVTLYLFNSITNFADLAYKFNLETQDNSTIVEAPAEANRLLTGTEVLSYYYNYVKNDLYSDSKNTSIYEVKINLNTEVQTPKILTKTDDSLDKVSKQIGMDNKYVLRYVKTYYKNEKKYVEIAINKATQEQIDAML